MYKVTKVKSAEMFPIIKEMLDNGNKVWITVTGMSMYPFLREDKDSVELSSASFESIRRGDIVLIKRETGAYVLHRVLRKDAYTFYMVGDAQQWVEGPLEPNQLIAAVTAVRRGQYTIDCNNTLWKMLTGMWLNIIPLRHWFFRGVQGVRKIYHCIKKDKQDIRRNRETDNRIT